MADGSSYVDLGDTWVNTFGAQNPKVSHFYLNTKYQYKREGSTVYYHIVLTLKYVNDSGSGGTYGYRMGVRLEFNNVADDRYWEVSSGIDHMYSGDVGSDYWDRSITNTTGSGTVPIDVYANNLSTYGFDSPGPHRLYLYIPPLDTFDVAFNANGGIQSTCPSTQKKTNNVTLTLPMQVPIRDNDETNGYTVTFNANGGVADYSSGTSVNSILYNFKNGNTAANGSGTSYSPGGDYTANSAVTLYAQWNSSSYQGGIYLPGATQTGYDFVGGTRDLDNVQLVEDGYVPTQNETLYAVGTRIQYMVNAKTSSGGKSPIVNIKQGSSGAYPLSDIKVKKTSLIPSAYTELSYLECSGTQYIIPNYTPTTLTKICCTFTSYVSKPIDVIGSNSDGSGAGANGGVRLFQNDDPLYLYNGFGAYRTLSRKDVIFIPNQKYTIEYSATALYANGVNCPTIASGSAFNPLRFFGDSFNAVLTFSGRIYGAQIYENGTLAANLVPVLRNNDLIPGMYDTVRGTFHTNGGTGSFGLGPKKTGGGNSFKDDTYAGFKVSGTEYASKEDGSGGQGLDSHFNADAWEIIESNGTYYIGIEPDVGGYFCLSEPTASSEGALRNIYIKNDYNYSVVRK